MKFLPFFAILALLLPILPAQADTFSRMAGTFSTDRHEDPTRPYYERGKDPHNIQWDLDNENWTPQEWVNYHNGDAQAMMQRLKDAGIVVDQYKHRRVPVLEVGQPYLRLSGLEKRRVAEFVDYVYGITKSSENGAFFIEREDTGQQIGVYTAQGLQIQ